MSKKNPVGYSVRTFNATQTKVIDTKLEKDIAESTEGSKEMREQMRRVFSAANKRIKRLEDSGELSPALEALKDNRHFGIGRFKENTGTDWENLKDQYGKAVAFLRSPTSTVSGAREFTEHVKQQSELNEDSWQKVKEHILKGYTQESNVLATRVVGSDRIAQEIYREAIEYEHNQMEKTAKEESDRLQEEINRAAKEAAKALHDFEEKAVNEFYDTMSGNYRRMS